MRLLPRAVLPAWKQQRTKQTRVRPGYGSDGRSALKLRLSLTNPMSSVNVDIRPKQLLAGKLLAQRTQQMGLGRWEYTDDGKYCWATVWPESQCG